MPGGTMTTGRVRRRRIAFAVSFIAAYQRLISARRRSRCVFEPSCSAYAVLAIEHQGLARGLMATMRRLWRCRAENLGVIDYPKGVGDVPHSEHRGELFE